MAANFDLKTEIAAYWDDRADTFDLSPNHPIQPGVQEAAWQAILRRHLPDVPEPRVLELGCGTGIVTLQLVRARARVTAMDLGERMLDLARAKAKAAGVTVEFVFGDAEDPFVAGNGFDAVVCRHLVWTLSDPATALRHWQSSLRPGGKAIVIDSFAPWNGWQRRATGLLANLLEGSARTRHRTIRDTDSPYHRLGTEFPFSTNGVPPADLTRMMGDAGYQSITLDPMSAVRAARQRTGSLAERLRMLGTRRFLVSGTRP